MLPAAARLTHRDDFTAVVRRGQRAGRTLVVVHVLVVDEPLAGVGPGVVHAGHLGPVVAKVGFVVSKAVGGSVVRHRVARRLRHLMRARLHLLPGGSRAVVRALPASATADSASLGRDLDRALLSALAARPPRPAWSDDGADGAGSSAPLGSRAAAGPRAASDPSGRRR